VGRKRAHYLDVPHEAGVQADQFEFVDACLLPGFLQRSVQFVEVQLVAERRMQRDVAVDALALLPGVRIRPTTGPAHSVVGHDQHVLVRRVVLRSPRDEIDQGLSRRHVELAFADQV